MRAGAQLLIFIGSVLFVAESLETIKVDKDWITAFHVCQKQLNFAIMPLREAEQLLC
eukprot:SAG31_NODE_61_length_29286_cov_444.645973_5_plen_57_part_00